MGWSDAYDESGNATTVNGMSGFASLEIIDAPLAQNISSHTGGGGEINFDDLGMWGSGLGLYVGDIVKDAADQALNF